MRTIGLALLGCLAYSVGVAQESLCNPCVDSPSTTGPRRPGAVPATGNPVVITADDMRNLGVTSVAEMISQLPSQAANAPVRISGALVAAALMVMPEGVTESETSAALAGGLWREDGLAVAVSLPRETDSLTFIFVRQANGSYAATDASRVVAYAAFGFFGWPAAEYERYETEPLRWQMRDGGSSLLYVQTRAWREGQRYTVNGHYLVGPDGSITNP